MEYDKRQNKLQAEYGRLKKFTSYLEVVEKSSRSGAGEDGSFVCFSPFLYLMLYLPDNMSAGVEGSKAYIEAKAVMKKNKFCQELRDKLQAMFGK